MATGNVPTDLRLEQKDRICGALSVGCDRTTAVNLVGCTLADLRRAMGADPEFADRVVRCEATIELMHMRTVQQAASEVKNWRTAAWWLERRAPERYGPRSPRALSPRQFQAFASMMIEIIDDGVRDEEDRRRVGRRLESLAESIEQMLRDAAHSGKPLPERAVGPPCDGTAIGRHSE